MKPQARSNAATQLNASGANATQGAPGQAMWPSPGFARSRDSAEVVSAEIRRGTIGSGKTFAVRARSSYGYDKWGACWFRCSAWLLDQP